MAMFTEGVKFFQKAIIFHPENDQFLTLKRRPDDSSPNMWDLPGGGVDFGEHHDVALVREILEETGLIIEDTRVVEVFTHYHDDTGIYILFIGHQCRAIHANVEMSAEHTAFQWVTAEKYQTLYAQPTLKELASKANAPNIANHR